MLCALASPQRAAPSSANIPAGCTPALLYIEAPAEARPTPQCIARSAFDMQRTGSPGIISLRSGGRFIISYAVSRSLVSRGSRSPMTSRARAGATQPPVAASVRSHAEHCARLARRGLCHVERQALDQFCPGACTTMTLAENVAALRKNMDFSVLSVYDYTRFDRSLCRSASEQARLRRSKCDNVDDAARLRDHGWVILRNVALRGELDAIVTDLEAIPEPLRSNCGSSKAHPSECFRNLRHAAPHFYRTLHRLVQDWIASGLHEEAHLGWPYAHLAVDSQTPRARAHARP